MLSIDRISKSYIQRGKVLDELSAEINEGDSISITGPSGSGKTTLLNILGLLDKPDSGHISFRGNRIDSFSDGRSAEYRNRNIGFVFQDHMLLPHLTVSENINLPLLASDYRPEELFARKEHITGLMKRTGISDLSSKHPFQISGGEAQRVALVRALANNPSVLLADEPTGSLDLKNAVMMGELLLEMNHDFGITIILATHSGSLAGKMARQLRLEEGKLFEI